MVRESTDTDAAMVCATVHGDGLTSLQYRKEKRGQVEEILSPIKHPQIIQLERRSGSFLMSVAKSGDPFWTVELPHLQFSKKCLLAFLFAPMKKMWWKRHYLKTHALSYLPQKNWFLIATI
ncbi:hypothetical protein Q2T40_01710 [Winogradskyella maritima]|nr:hypothetical protein [Winogradskyella maritima]